MCIHLESVQNDQSENQTECGQYPLRCVRENPVGRSSDEHSVYFQS